jgi:hypothetical protein
MEEMATEMMTTQAYHVRAHLCLDRLADRGPVQHLCLGRGLPLERPALP